MAQIYQMQNSKTPIFSTNMILNPIKVYHNLCIEYIQQEEMIYNGLQMRLDRKMLLRFVINLRKKIGDNTYVRRLGKFVQFVTGGEDSIVGMEELLQEDLADN